MPPMVQRYTVTAVDESGQECAREVYRTFHDAKNASLKLSNPDNHANIER